MMDSHYRTLSGFIELIEKEWFAFGHKFMDRFGFSMEGWCSDDRSPVFQQFIECVYQFMAQMPHVFEINEALLIFILRGLQSGLFGNIYADCEKDRQHYHHSTLSIWNAVLSNQAAFTNPSYIMTDRVCVPVTSAKRIVLWNSWFLLWHDLVWSRIWFGRMENLVAADESFVDSLMPPMRWVDNSATKTCSDPSCGRPFTVYRRRHHCRACGLIFCERCSSHRRIVTSVSSSTLSRTCRNCAHEIDMANRFKSRTVSRPQAVGNTASKRREYNERVLVMSDGSDDEILFSPNNHAAVGSSEFGRKPRVGSIVRNFEQMGENRRSDAAAAKRRSRSFSELPN